MDKKIKVLIIYNKVWSYRVKIFELLNKKFDLTVSFTDPQFTGKKFDFKTIFLPVKKVGPFSIHTNNLNKVTNKFDVIIGLSDIRWLRLMLLGFKPNRKYKLIYWGIGVRASYENKFDSKTKLDIARFFLTKRADAIIFYSSYPIKKYIKAGFDKKKLFVANNTVNAPFDNSKDYKRDQLLFIGTLYPQKGIEILLEAYKQLKEEGESILPLKIVGGGEYYKKLVIWVQENDLMNEIELLGPIYEADILEDIFRRSIACISPKQAGLSVLSCMAYSCVFVTKKDAITGGEIFNIKDNETGLFYDGSIEDLKKKIIYIHKNREEINQIGKNAFLHYRNYRTPEMMAGAIEGAINFSLSKK